MNEEIELLLILAAIGGPASRAIAQRGLQDALDRLYAELDDPPLFEQLRAGER